MAEKQQLTDTQIFKRWLRRFAYLAAPVLFWILLGQLHLISANLYGIGILVIAVLLFFFGMPLSIPASLDVISRNFHIQDSAVPLFFGLAIVLLNFALFAGIGWLLRRMSKKKNAAKSGIPEEKSDLKSYQNGKAPH